MQLKAILFTMNNNNNSNAANCTSYGNSCLLLGDNTSLMSLRKLKLPEYTQVIICQ